MTRKLRTILGEFLIETGERIRDIGGFILPDYERHPAFRSNDDLDGQSPSVGRIANGSITNRKL